MQTTRYKSTAEYVTAELRKLVLTGYLKPGARLDQMELAAKLDVSRHPVRQAIERLAERGFVEIHPHRSAVVAEISVEDMTELYAARNEAEAFAIRTGWRRYDARLGETLAGLAEGMRSAAADDLDAFMAANREFHLLLYRPCGNRYVLGTIERLFDISERYQRLALNNPARVRRSIKEHAEILAALRSADLDRLIKAVLAHNSGAHTVASSEIRKQLQAA